MPEQLDRGEVAGGGPGCDEITVTADVTLGGHTEATLGGVAAGVHWVHRPRWLGWLGLNQNFLTFEQEFWDNVLFN